ncbi:NitT/TauT family transport system substrate-binding protein [Kibdelosporangium banguiense]|uniref:NitT/TauT family transport system substrate-binding protein n=1 Tax=Kibdelosporangium banguiense TaxID=1365924 RepID=A0ABS4T5H6_9PSEU|nr:ABC transporter substrate-binding protein [Kibdelosporangium banguiense]MBP2319709.1 NitT/TauT family transport system substrate-binding protein [Kibdelosporangium banguiense]
MSTSRTLRLLAAVTAALALAAGCSRAGSGSDTPVQAQAQGPAEVRLGYFPNVTHAPAIIGQKKEFYAKELGSTKLAVTNFNAGPEEVNALLGKSLDIGFIGSGPAINAFTKSEGEIQLISGAVSGGAQLVTKADITSVDQLAGKNIATPSLGNTQDVALKKLIHDKNIKDVKITNLDNPKTLDAFRKGELDGAWLPEPWSSRLVLDAGAKVLLDEKTLWPDGRFPTTVIIVRKQFLQQYPQTVQAILRGHVNAIEWAKSNEAEAKTVVNATLKELAGSSLSQPVLDSAFKAIELTTDPIASTFPQLAKDSVTAGIVKQTADLKGFADLSALNEALKATGKPAVDAAGLDKK